VCDFSSDYKLDNRNTCKTDSLWWCIVFGTTSDKVFLLRINNFHMFVGLSFVQAPSFCRYGGWLYMAGIWDSERHNIITEDDSVHDYGSAGNERRHFACNDISVIWTDRNDNRNSSCRCFCYIHAVSQSAGQQRENTI